jgi:DNA-binding CsgD family transcriptional regulator
LIDYGCSNGRRKPNEPRPNREEADLVGLIGKGNSTSSIARDLGLSVKTIETYQGHIKEKLGLANGEEMVEFATDMVNHREMS